MGIATTCAAVAASAMIATTTSAGVMPRQAPWKPSSNTDIALSATVYPIVDLEGTIGPVELARYLAISIDQFTSSLLVELEAQSETGWDAGELVLEFNGPAQVGELTPSEVGLEFRSEFESEVELESLLAGETVSELGVAAGFRPVVYVGVTKGAGLRGSLLELEGYNEWEPPFGGGFSSEYETLLGIVDDSNLVTLPDGGLRAEFDSIPFALFGSAEVELPSDLGDIEMYVEEIALTVESEVCAGSAASCGGVFVSSEVRAPFRTALYSDVLSDIEAEVNIPNELAVELTDEGLTLEGAVGGELKIGSTTFGKIITFDRTIPLGVTGFTRQSLTRASAAASTPAASSPAVAVGDAGQDQPAAATKTRRTSRGASAHNPRHENTGVARSPRNSHRDSTRTVG